MAIDLYNGLVGLWRFNEGSGIYAVDSSDQSNDGTVVNTVWTTDGKYGDALDFDGNGDYVDCGSDSSICIQQSGWTFSAWIKPSSSDGVSPNRNSMYVAGPAAWWIVLTSNDILLQQMSSPWSEISSYGNEIQNGNWYHILITSYGTEKKIYINNTLVKTGTLSVPDATCSKIGFGYTSTDGFNGTIDEVRVYNRVLNSDEISYLYVNPDGIDINLSGGLVGYWPLNEGIGTSSTDDKSTNSNTGTLNNIDNGNWLNGKSGTALDLNGTNEYIDCSNNSTLDILGSFSISMWVYISTGASGGRYLLSKNTVDRSDVQYGFMWSDTYNSIKAIFNGTYYGASAHQSVLTGQWNHIVAVYNMTDMRYYVNGVLSGTPCAITDAITSTTHKLSIGRRNPNHYYFDGIMDEIRLYNKGLNVDEVESLYNNPYGTRIDLTTYKLIVTDLNGSDHTITDDLHNLNIDIVTSSAADTFSFDITNINDGYSYIEKGCEIKIMMGVDGANKIKITGIITDVLKQLEGQLVVPYISVSGEDMGSRLKKVKFSKRYYDLELSALIKAILDDTDFSTGKTYRELADLSADYDFIESTSYSVEIASYNWKSLSSSIAELAESVGYDWYVDIHKRLHFYDPTAVLVSDTIVDDNLHGNPVIGTTGEIVNRSIVIGGHQEVTDQTGVTQTTTFKVTNAISKSESFVPTNDYLTSMFVYTKLETPSDSEIEISIQADDGASAPDGINLSNGQMVLPLENIVDNGYSEFKFENDVTLTPGETYWFVLDGTTGNGQLIGVDASENVDFETKYPARIAVMKNNTDSQDRYGMYMAPIYRDENILDPDLAEIRANQMLNPNPKKTANIITHGDEVTANDVINLTISKVGVSIDKTMKILRSSQLLDHRYIVNKLELEEI